MGLLRPEGEPGRLRLPDRLAAVGRSGYGGGQVAHSRSGMDRRRRAPCGGPPSAVGPAGCFCPGLSGHRPHPGGGGGGRPNMAQAGGKNPAGIPDAIAKAAEIVKSQTA